MTVLADVDNDNECRLLTMTYHLNDRGSLDHHPVRCYSSRYAFHPETMSPLKRTEAGSGNRRSTKPGGDYVAPKFLTDDDVDAMLFGCCAIL